MVFPLEEVGPHELKLKGAIDQFDFSAGTEPASGPVTIMLFTNRSGSSMVAEYLRATGKFRGMGEPLTADLVLTTMEQQGLRTFHQYLKWRFERDRTEQSMYGMKASHQQAMMLLRSGMIPGYFPDVRWLVVQRNDILAQAVSFEIASQTRRWESFAEQTEVKPQYDFERIRYKVQALSLQNAAIRAFCSAFGIRPCWVNYEEFSASPVEATNRLAASLGKEGARVDESLLRRQKQRDAINMTFQDRFTDEYRSWLLSRG